ncbi:DUF6603 domain-containing protein [Streptosporangium sp. NPDC000396]|uniref:DUF6603 domain-containing protein n=1 Tax=Streptosporangium sp. NPDC000396 TaxID=3366185 RepID=UPI0036CC55BB
MPSAETKTLVELINELFGTQVPLPGELTPVLENVVYHDNLPSGETLVTAQAPGYDDPGAGSSPVQIVAIMTKRAIPGTTLSAVLIDAPLGFDASRLTLVGEFIPGGLMVFPNLRVIVVSREMNVAAVNQLNAVLAEYGVTSRFPRPNAMSADVWPKYVSASVTWKLKGGEMPALAIVQNDDEEKKEKQEEEIGFPGMPVSFGPLTLSGVKRSIFKDHWKVLLVGELKVGGQVFQLDGLGLMIPTSLKGAIPKAMLVGVALGIRRENPTLRVNAALRYTGLGDEAISSGLAGLVKVETDALSLMGAGNWSRAADGYTTIFLYLEALLTSGASLFGPPPFTVTGLAGGFGINSKVRPPSAAQLPSFPLLARLEEAPSRPGDPPPKPPEPLDMLNDLTGPSGWVRPEEGSYWIAAGLSFTSFRFIETRALALIEFGNRLNVMILGRTSFALPRNKNATRKYARLNIDLRLAYISDEHLLTLEAAVGAGSFIYSEAAELTGGLAFCVWTGGGRGGDFVLTIGGYHPQFQRNMPGYYPTPTRIGFRWSPCSRVVIQASGYAALTPGAIMFGGALAARYEKGLLSAWFTAHLDALIQWKPFYLDLALGISIGVAFTIKVWFVKVRVSIEVGIDLQLWTPPTGGRVSVKVWFVEFGFNFGAGRQGAPPVPWEEFQMQLPGPIRSPLIKGRLLDVEQGEDEARSTREAPALVSTGGFTFATEAALPTSEILLNRKSKFTGPAINIRPMRLENVTSRHIVRLTRFENGREVEFDPDANEWEVTPITRGMQRSMWGKPGRSSSEVAEEPGLEPDCLTGLLFDVSPPDLGNGTGPVTSQALGFEPLEDGAMPLRDASPAGPAPRADDGSIEKIARTLAAQGTAANRTAVFDALARLGASPGKDADGLLGHYADLVGRSMTSSPLLTDAPTR